MTQDDFKVLTGEAVNYSDADWSLITAVASERLASFLCLETLPEFSDANRDLEQLFATFLLGCLKLGTGENVTSKTVRNFSIGISQNASDAFRLIYNQNRDTIEKYSGCTLGVKVERSRCHYCNGDDVHGFVNF